MKRAYALTLVVTAGIFAAAFTPVNNNAAPTFSLENAAGKKVSLEDYKGKWVVLEWWNNGCPVVKRHYNSGNIPKLQAEFKEKGVVWLSIVSSAPGKQGYVTVDNAKSAMDGQKGVPSEILLDPTGATGKAYDARTTPQMVLISPKQEVMYNGAIDNDSRGNLDKGSIVNYLVEAYNEASAGKPVSKPKTQPYGCNVKY
jgi:peroxiredoxin